MSTEIALDVPEFTERGVQALKAAGLKVATGLSGKVPEVFYPLAHRDGLVYASSVEELGWFPMQWARSPSACTSASTLPW